MTKEQKQLLFKDLCARLPYKVKAQYFDIENECFDEDTIEYIDVSGKEPEIGISQYGISIDKIKPYLRPMSSITKEEEKELIHEFRGSHTTQDSIEELDWYLQRHFDIRDLISKGLALEAPKGIYNIKQK